MKKTLKEDQERLVLQSELLNDNALLEYTADRGYMIVGVRYVDGYHIEEDIVLMMNIVDYMKHQEALIELNEDKSAIATFRPTDEGYVLTDVYDTVEHRMGIPEFVDIEYQNRFPNKKLIKDFYKK